MEILTLEQRHEGAIGESGRFTGYTINKKGEKKKDATYDYKHIDWERHFSGKDFLGLSPVKIIQNGNGRKGLCRWVAWDLDIDETPEKFCRAVFKIAHDLFCYRTSSNRWHVYYYLDELRDVEEAKSIAQEYEVKLKKVWPKGVDTSHSLPKGYNVAEGKSGGWLFQPYCTKEDLMNNKLCGYSPSGQPLTKEQIEYSIAWRKHPLIRSLVGATEGQGGREKFLFMAQQVIEAYNLDLTPEQVNDQFTNSYDYNEAKKYIDRHNKKDYVNEFNKEYLLEHYETYLEAVNGFWRKDLAGVGVLDGFLDPDQEAKAKEFLENIIYIKLDNRWYDKSTGQEYDQKSIQITYGHIYGGRVADVLKNFVAYEKAQLVEKGVYRPDLFKSIEEPIVKDEKGLLQLNQYRPSELEALPPDTPERKAELELFLTLIERLTENEGVGYKGPKREEIKLYDYVLDHLSMPFQQPGNKVRSALIFHSEQYQVGKNTYFQIIQEGLGVDNCAVITPEEAISRERSFLENQLVLIDEILIDGDYKKKISTLNVLKPLMTNEIHSSRPLYKNWRQVFSTCGFTAFTNFKHAIAIKNNEARYTPIDVNKSRDEMGGDEFFNKIWTPEGKIRGTISNVVKYFLSTRKISENFDPKSPSLKTNFLEEMSKAGGHPLLLEIEGLFKEGATPFHQSLFSIQEAFEYLKVHKKMTGRINDFADALKLLGCERVGECFHKLSRRKPTLWIKDNHDFFCDKSMSQMVNEYWLPVGAWINNMRDYSEWYLTSNDTPKIIEKIREIKAFEDFHRGKPEDDPEEDFETIRRKRNLK